MIASLIANARLERILRLLDQERKVILSGPLTRLAGLVARREAVVADLLAQQGADLPEAFLGALKARAERNSRLLLASLAGIRAAQAQLAGFAAAADQLRTYSAAGVPLEVRSATVTRDQRA